MNEGGKKFRVDHGLKRGVSRPGEERTTCYGSMVLLVRRAVQCAEHDAVVHVRGYGSLVEVGEVGEQAPPVGRNVAMVASAKCGDHSFVLFGEGWNTKGIY